MDSSMAPSLLLLGTGSDCFREQLIVGDLSWTSRVRDGSGDF